jgi:predicted Holliday junction resolvase-like endonuclease
MDLFLFFVFAILFLALAAIAYYFFSRTTKLEEKISQLHFQKSSQSVKYGKTMEQFLPFSENFPFSKQDFRFLGAPIDGIAFEQDKIVFVEFKAANSQLSEKQKRIKQLVQNKHVEWFEMKAQ